MSERRIWPYATDNRPPEFLGTVPGERFDAFRVAMSNGQAAVFIVPRLDDDYPPDLKAAVERRRRATLYGRCDCGARARAVLLSKSNRRRASLIHEDDCPASNEQLVAIGKKYGIDFFNTMPETSGWPEVD